MKLQFIIIAIVGVLVFVCIKILSILERFRCCKRTQKKCCKKDDPNVDGTKVDGPTVDGAKVDGPTVDGPTIDTDNKRAKDPDEFVLPKTEAEYNEFMRKYGGTNASDWSEKSTGPPQIPLPDHVKIPLPDGRSINIPKDWPTFESLNVGRCTHLHNIQIKASDIACFHFPVGEKQDYFWTMDYGYSQNYGYSTRDPLYEFESKNRYENTAYPAHSPNGRRLYKFFEDESTSKISPADYSKERGAVLAYPVRNDSIGITMMIINNPDADKDGWATTISGYNRFFYNAENKKSFEQWINFATYGKIFIHPKNIKFVWNVHYPSLITLRAPSNIKGAGQVYYTLAGE